MGTNFALYILALASFALSAVLHAVALQLFPKWNLLDNPEKYGLTRKQIPYPTGIISVAVFLCFFLAFLPMSKQGFGIALGVVCMAILTFVDDRKGLPASARLLVQLMVAILIFGMGTRIYSITNPILPDAIIKLDTIIIPFALFSDPPVLSGIFTIIWLILTMNALNWFDGIPGQVSVISTIGFLTLSFLALSSRVDHVNPELQLQLALLAFILAGISVASMLFDFPPNLVVMGDTGAMFFGLLLGILTIYAGGKVATAFLVLGVPLIDSGIVVLRRIAKKASPLRGNADDEHLHHRLLQKGWSERQIIVLTAVLGSAFGLSALFLNTREKIAAAFLLFCIMIALSYYSKPKNALF